MIFDSLNEDVRVRRTTGKRGTLVCKIADTMYDLCMTFQCWTEDQTLCTLFSLLFFQHMTRPIRKNRQFATVCTYPHIVDRPRLQCCPRSECGVSEYVLGWRWLQTLTHTHINTYTHTDTNLWNNKIRRIVTYRAANLWKLKSVIRMLKNRNFGQKSVISSMVFATSRKQHVIKRCIKKKEKKRKRKMMFAHTTLIKHKSH